MRAKDLDNSGWYGILTRKIYPSDVDMIISDNQGGVVVDNGGRILFVEYSSNAQHWEQVKKGQRLLYRNIVRNGKGSQFAALCYLRHRPVEERWDTVNDVLSFEIMYWAQDEVQVVYSANGKAWSQAVLALIFGK